jgi:hypothetical protein
MGHKKRRVDFKLMHASDLSIEEPTAEESLGGTKKEMTQKRYCLNSSETPLNA